MALSEPLDGALLLIETDIWASQLKKQFSNKTRQFRGAAQNTLITKNRGTSKE
jgi:hypothetical protein